tara:strand:+ start:2311 stop:2712 length:402 start_codon:yes stop_codon:yes gene_type:complete
MCFGGGGSPAKITKPDYTLYNQQFDLQKDAIVSSMNNQTTAIQNTLTEALTGKGDIQKELLAQKKLNAENTQAQAMRLAQVIGPPPREEHADAPTIGDQDRGLRKRRRGKSSLRIGRKATSGTGSGLNLTYSS